MAQGMRPQSFALGLHLSIARRGWLEARVRGRLSMHNVAILPLDYDERRIEFIIDVSIVFMLVD